MKIKIIRIKILVYIVMVFILFNCKPAQEIPTNSNTLPVYQFGAPASNIQEFEQILENMRQTLNIPGMSAGIVDKNKLVWSKGFGMARKDTDSPSLPKTKFHLASLTKPFGAVVIMSLVEEGLLRLDDLVSKYGVTLDNSNNVTVKHLLSHTSGGVPGTTFFYNGARYALLGDIIESCSGQSFCELLRDRILKPFKLSNTASNPLHFPNCMFTDDNERNKFMSEMAEGYSSDGYNVLVESAHFSPAAGLISSVRDLAEFSNLLDKDQLLTAESKEKMYTSVKSNNGVELGYGLGWFVDHKNGVKILWHYGNWDAHSSLILKIPEINLTFIVLANSNMLSIASEGIGTDNNVSRSIAAGEFLNAFIYGSAKIPK